MPSTRANLRTALQYHTDGKLTSSTDQDYYLNEAEQDVFADWRKFDPGLFRPVRDSVATSATGILLFDANFARIEYMEDASHNEYREIKDMNKVYDGTGYYFIGYDQTNNKRQVLVIKNGSPVASTTLYWFNIASMVMASPDASQSAIPPEHRKLISYRAAFLYYQDKGPAFLRVKESWKKDYLEALSDARQWYKNVSKNPQYVSTVDPDAGDYGTPSLRQNV